MPKELVQNTKTIQVLWPIPTTASLQEALFNILAVIKGQNADKDIKIFSIFVGDVAYKGLVFQDVRNQVTINCFNDESLLAKNYMEITFAVSDKKS